VPALGDLGLGALERGRHVQREDLGAGGHDLSGVGVVELDDPLDHLPLVLVDDAFLLALLDDRHDLLLDLLLPPLVGRGLGLGGPAGGAGHEQVGQVHHLQHRRQHGPEPVQRADEQRDERLSRVHRQRVWDRDGREQVDHPRDQHREQVLHAERVPRAGEQRQHPDQHEDVRHEPADRGDQDEVVGVLDRRLEVPRQAAPLEVFGQAGAGEVAQRVRDRRKQERQHRGDRDASQDQPGVHRRAPLPRGRLDDDEEEDE
jgi:hypothetical protein